MTGGAILAAGVLAAALFGAAGRRVAGGLWPAPLPACGTQPKRLVWAAVSGLTVAPAGALYALAVAAAVWGGSCLFGTALPGQHGTAMNMGRPPGDPLGKIDPAQFRRDFLGMTYHGLGFAWIAAPAWYFGQVWPLPLAAGLLCAPCYALGWYWKPRAPELGMLNDPRHGLVDSCPAAEAIWGAVCGASLFAAYWLA